MGNKTSTSHLRVCPSCDLAQRVPPLQRGERAHCARCQELLHEVSVHGLDHVLAWHLTSLMLFFVAFTHPFLGLRAGTLESNSTLLDGVRELWQQGLPLVALLVLLTGALLPLLYTVAVLYLTVPMFFARRPPLALPVCHLLAHLSQWKMVEVMALGVLVALIKLTGIAEVLFGAAFYALITLLYTFTLSVRSLDMEQLWNWLRPADAA